MPPLTVALGGSAAHVRVGAIAHGLMLMTWKATPVPDDQCFESIKAGIDALPEGAVQFLNSSEFYGIKPREANLELVARFFDKYPELEHKTFLSVKGGTKADTLVPDASEENIRRSVDCINAKLRGKKKLDLFQNARVDKSVPIEDVMRTMVKLVKEGKFDHIGLSEVSADTLRRACAVAPVAAVEIEVSPWSYEEETKKVIATAKELGVAVIAYSPLGRGFLTGAVTSPSALEEGDFRRTMPRFQEEAFKRNLAIVDKLKVFADKTGVTPAQLSLAWVRSRGPHVIPLPGSSHAKRTLENAGAIAIEFTDTELTDLDALVDSLTSFGERYPAHTAHFNWG